MRDADRDVRWFCVSGLAHGANGRGFVGPMRTNCELERDLEGVSQKVLTDSLRQMEDDGLVFRHDYGENPLRVEYGLTELGRQMMPVVDSLPDFGAY